MRSPSTLRNVRVLLACVVVALGTIAAHWPVLQAEAITFDDDEYLTENPLVQRPGWESARRFASEVLEPSTVRGYYQPLSMISLMADHAMGGRSDRLTPFHRTSLALHATNAVLVVLILFILFDRIIPAITVALLFGLHPMTIESVAWIAERKTLLAAFFAFLSLLAYIQCVKTRGRAFYFASIAAFLCSLLSKPSSTPLPLVLLLLDCWPLNRLGFSTRSAVPNRDTSPAFVIVEKAPYFFLAAASAVVTVISQGNTYGVSLPHERGLFSVLLVVCHNIVFYLEKILWPFALSWYYPYPSPFTVTHPAVLMGLIGTMVLAATAVISLRRTRAWAVGVSAFVIALLPTLGIISFWGLIAADRFVYFPAIGLALPLAWMLGQLYKERNRAVVVSAILCVWAVSLGMSTHHQLSHWQDSESLSRRMVKLVPDAAVPRIGLGNALQTRGLIAESIAEYQTALQLEPKNTNALTALGAAFSRIGKNEDAIAQYQRALEVDPADVRAMNNLGVALMGQRRFDESVVQYQGAITKKPDYAPAHQNLASALLSLGKNTEALEQAKIAVALSPQSPRAYHHLAGIYAAMGKVDEAIAASRKALELKPDYPESHDRLAGLLASRGEFTQAAEHGQQAVRLRPDVASYRLTLANTFTVQNRLADAESEYREVLKLAESNKTTNESTLARANLAQILADQKRFDESIAVVREAISLQPNDPDLHYRHAVALHQADRLPEAIDSYQQSLKLQPNNPAAVNNLGAAFADLDRLEEAADTYRRAIALDPKNATFRINLAEVLVRQNQTAAALAMFREALLLDPLQVQLQTRINELSRSP